ncbi:methyltransferase domain-containing protein [Exilibacterium tricleocarpae]|uniref:tRNA 5-carboxymethoxyuridine methyltransferase n=1 Tax=Exilibacterium tricleocarpae TaxID=2591008 RepID=A0A545TM84_9GAMM|nr:methyltransferase domain-containing protein [Exilibacterium tricleocarpae]TQV78251.1 methyltransferase domain-containing protein [Exilibacterium tricleocarpae]
MDQDRNFDDLAPRFKRNIYAGLKGELRLQVLQRDFDEFIPQLAQRPLRVLDAGGGQGQMAVALAQRGHSVLLCDISANMLALARAEVQAAGVGDRVELVNRSIQALAGETPGRFDLVLCHAVMEWLAEPETVLRLLAAAVKPGGFLSLTFYNVEALIFKNLLRTNFKKIRTRDYRGYRGSLTPTNPLAPAQVEAWLRALPVNVLCRSGIRVFHDYILDKTDRQRDPQGLLEMELQFSRREPYRSLGRYIHVLCQVPG